MKKICSLPIKSSVINLELNSGSILTPQELETITAINYIKSFIVQRQKRAKIGYIQLQLFFVFVDFLLFPIQLNN